MNKLACEILEQGSVRHPDGHEIPLHSNTSLGQGEFLVRQIREIGANVTLEIGLAYGISALFICDEIHQSPGAKHYAIDPYQLTDSWSGLGLEHLTRAGLRDVCDFRNDLAENVLPQLAQDGVQLDFAYVDAGKRMDNVLIYTHYLTRMSRIGGRIAYDDVCYPGIRKALRYLVQQKHFRVAATWSPSSPSLSRRMAKWVAS